MCVDDEEIVVNVVRDAVYKAKLIMETFNVEERFSQIDTYQKETFDLLWKICKLIKPIVSTLLPEQRVFACNAHPETASSGPQRLVVISMKKERVVALTPELIKKAQVSAEYKVLCQSLLSEYETIISNLVGYSDVLSMMTNYRSKLNLFKYSIALAQEGSVMEATSKDAGMKALARYSEARLVLELIVREDAKLYSKEILHLAEDESQLEYAILGPDGKPADSDFELRGKDVRVGDVLRLEPLKAPEVLYLRGLRRELDERCRRLSTTIGK